MSVPSIFSDPVWKATLFDHAPVAILVCSRNGVVRAGNMAFAALAGYTVGELEGQTLWAYIHAAEHKAIRGGLNDMESGGSFELCVRLAHRSGRYQFVRLHVAGGDSSEIILCHLIAIVTEGDVAVTTPEGQPNQLINVSPLPPSLVQLAMQNPRMAIAVACGLLVIIGREHLVELLKLWLSH